MNHRHPPVSDQDLERLLAEGFELSEVPVAPGLEPYRDRWLKEMKEELLSLRGGRIDPRFIGSVAVQ